MNYLATSKFRVKLPGQVMVSTLIMLIVVSLAAAVITTSVARNARQVSTNVAYEKAISYAESRLISAVEPISALVTLSAGVQSQLFEVDSCRSETIPPENVTGIVCGWNELDGWRTIVSAYDSKTIESYSLPVNETLQINLYSGASGSYNGRLNVWWEGNSAAEFSLVYASTHTGTNEFHQDSYIFDPGGNLTNAAAAGSSQMFVTPLVRNAQGIVQLDLNPGNIRFFTANNSAVNFATHNVSLRYLKIRLLSRGEFNSKISVSADTAANFPAQVRKYIAVSYNPAKTTFESSPALTSEVPLASTVPSVLDYALNFDALQTPICGNKVKEGKEFCDDGSLNGQAGNCNATCSAFIPLCGNGKIEAPEVCDEGAQNGIPSHCNATCTGIIPLCGNGIREGSEVCDDGAQNGIAGKCNTSCTGTVPTCTWQDACVEGGGRCWNGGDPNNSNNYSGGCVANMKNHGTAGPGEPECPAGFPTSTGCCIRTDRVCI